jgi:16S rRNA (uracil1498-N3)-methyltransferase
MQLFYFPDINGTTVSLTPEESKHMIKVLRLNAEDEVQLVDGKGGFYSAKIKDANPKKCELKILNTQQDFGKRNFGIHIAIAPTKNSDRFEWFLEKATELGIDEITPLLTANSERKTIKPERLQKILISAMKQSLKAYLPKLNPLASFNDVIQKTNEKQKFIAHCHSGNKIHLKDVIKSNENCVILIGPEGDFNEKEIEFANQNNFTSISLGKSRLRTETAGVAACHIVNLANDL